MVFQLTSIDVAGPSCRVRRFSRRMPADIYFRARISPRPVTPRGGRTYGLVLTRRPRLIEIVVSTGYIQVSSMRAAYVSFYLYPRFLWGPHNDAITKSRACPVPTMNQLYGFGFLVLDSVFFLLFCSNGKVEVFCVFSGLDFQHLWCRLI